MDASKFRKILIPMQPKDDADLGPVVLCRALSPATATVPSGYPKDILKTQVKQPTFRNRS